MINLKLRLKNPVFITQVIWSVVLPVMGYFGVNVEDITSFSKFFELILLAISNPYVLLLIGTSLINAINDPTTKGFKDSPRVQSYKELH